MRYLFLALVLAGCGGPFDLPPCDAGHAADAGAVDMVQPADLGPFLCGNGVTMCHYDQVCVSGDCVPACYFADGGCGDASALTSSGSVK